METYEEKYKDLIKRLNKAREEKGVYTFNSVLDAVAPELKIDESEDERIRKWLICLLNSMQYHHCDDEREMGNKALAWLEKQGESKENDICDNCEQQGNYVSPFCGKLLEKNGEQEPADNVEPRFKVGDIIKNKKNGDTVKVEQILSDSYCYSGCDGAATIHSDFLISDQGNWELIEQKPAWSEEDEDAIGMAIIALDDMYDPDEPNNTYAGYSMPFNKAAERLKSLRPQSHWKPSDEQMKALIEACVFKKSTATGAVLCELYHDLEKLREE